LAGYLGAYNGPHDYNAHDSDVPVDTPSKLAFAREIYVAVLYVTGIVVTSFKKGTHRGQKADGRQQDNPYAATVVESP